MELLPVKELRGEEILLRLEKTCEARPEKQWVPAYYFSICLRDGTKIGHCDLRVGHNDRLYIGGNIGYGIDEAHRGHHYASEACKLLLDLARKHHMGYVIITCDPDNMASRRTCELAGGKYMETAAVPEWHNMYEEGMRRVRVYRFELEDGQEGKAGVSDSETVRQQYGTASRLNTRISIHSKYSTNKQGFGNWIVSHYRLREGMSATRDSSGSSVSRRLSTSSVSSMASRPLTNWCDWLRPCLRGRDSISSSRSYWRTSRLPASLLIVRTGPS